MAVNAREPRLPLEPEEYPLYRPPRRFGCSGLTIVTLLFLGAFALLFWRVTPDIVGRGIINPLKQLTSGGATPTVEGGAAGALATQTAQAAPPTAIVVEVSPTPFVEYVKVAQTGGQGVQLRIEARTGSRYSVVVGEGAVLRIVGPDQPDSVNPSNIWRNVQLLPPDGRKGWILSKFLIPDRGP
jgi:hypothetical protein